MKTKYRIVRIIVHDNWWNYLQSSKWGIFWNLLDFEGPKTDVEMVQNKTKTTIWRKLFSIKKEKTFKL